ncbi:MAG: 50S ribosomal protein L28 [Treponema sp.]|nr:50S ribosomal protein L28 [Treponema sp.]
MRICDVCGKSVQHGNRVSKSYNHTRHTWRPNLHKMKIVFNGTTRTINICTQCIRSDFVTKKVRIPKEARLEMEAREKAAQNTQPSAQ